MSAVWGFVIGGRPFTEEFDGKDIFGAECGKRLIVSRRRMNEVARKSCTSGAAVSMEARSEKEFRASVGHLSTIAIFF